jgi:hypothetical protein
VALRGKIQRVGDGVWDCGRRYFITEVLRTSRGSYNCGLWPVD